MPTTRSQADSTVPNAPVETEAGDGPDAAAPTRGLRRRREEFFIHPEILLGGAGYRRLPGASEDEPGT